jgi:uncharacterized Rossmann fold enzyme
MRSCQIRSFPGFESGRRVLLAKSCPRAGNLVFCGLRFGLAAYHFARKQLRACGSEDDTAVLWILVMLE